jgi:hypothetical protein
MPYNAGKSTGRNLTNLSILTDYRPNFCIECGEAIVRLRWRVWTDRRFCDKCVPRFRKDQWTKRTILIVGFIVCGVLIGRSCRRESPPLVIHRPVNAPTQTDLASQPPPTVEETYKCGARTKKGTPCSRRVNGPVRCWQHKGAKAMLPPDKLIIKD